MALIIKQITSLVCAFLYFGENACLFLLGWCFSWLGLFFGFFFIFILIIIHFGVRAISLSDEVADIVLVLIKIEHVSSSEKVDAVELNMIDDLTIFDSTVPQVSKHFGPELFL